MRGKELGVVEEIAKLGITPAYAGKSAVHNPHKNGNLGSPPRMRGKVSIYSDWPVELGITPAYAGKRPRFPTSPNFHRDHPRVCGEKNVIYWDTDSCKGSPPRMRGKELGVVEEIAKLGITPAYAGKRAC